MVKVLSGSTVSPWEDPLDSPKGGRGLPRRVPPGGEDSSAPWRQDNGDSDDPEAPFSPLPFKKLLLLNIFIIKNFNEKMQD